MGEHSMPKRIKVLAVASSGGHWGQLMQLRPALEPFQVTYVTTNPAHAQRDGIADAMTIPDANRASGAGAVHCFVRAWSIVLRARPDVVISTGAMPGLFCLVAGRALRARTIWIDSVGNVEKLSLSGSLARRVATLWLTQWEHLAGPNGPAYAGSVL
jgi:hypothetical protein